MTVLELIIFLVVATLCGAIARAIGGGTRGGFVVSLLVGFLGAYVGTWIARMLHLPVILAVTIAGHPFPIVWSILGGIALVAIAHAFMGPTYRRRVL